MKKILILDSMNIAYKMFFKLPHLTNSEGLQTSTIYGFLMSMQSLYRKFNPDVIALAWDSYENKRKQIDPIYKRRDRKSIPHIKEFIEECVKLKKKLEQIGLPTLYCDGLESDDVIAAVLENKNEYIICSTDNDLYQLLDDNISIWNNKDIITKDWFIRTYGFEPRLFTIYKAIAGCESDNVKGINNIGKKKTFKLMESCKFDVDNIYRKIDSLGFKKEFNHSLRLVALPFELKYDIELPELKMVVNKKELIKFLYENDIHSLDVESFCKR
jgi:DNA polymerase-1